LSDVERRAPVGTARGAARPLAHWALLACLVVMWGSAFLLIKLAGDAFSPGAIAVGRLGLAFLVLAPFAALSRNPLPRRPLTWLFLLAMAVVGNALPFWLIAWGVQGIDTGLAGILMAVMPLTTIVLAHLFVEGERLGASRLAGFLLGFAGIVVLMGPDALLGLQGSGSALWSQLAVLSGAVCYACNSIIARRRPAEGDAVMASTCVLGLATLLLLPLLLAAPGAPPAMDGRAADRLPQALAALAALGVVSTALATVVYFKLIAAAGPSFLALMNYLVPVWALVIGMALLGETPRASVFLALALILGGIGLAETRGRLPARRPPV
jgi:drug/metabolite transporter (DMT)-like permease